MAGLSSPRGAHDPGAPRRTAGVRAGHVTVFDSGGMTPDSGGMTPTRVV